jgi:hypothetical protein
VLVDAPTGAEGKAQSYQRMRALLHEGRVRLPDHPRLLRQLREVISRPTSGGGISLTSPRWRKGGHGDLVSALVLALYPFGGHQERAPRAALTAKQAADAEQAVIFKATLERFGRKPEKPWWKR